jgi:hypothetical protein
MLHKDTLSDTIIRMIRKKPILEYESGVDIYPNIITPAKNHIPEWYKKITKWKNNEIFTLEKGFEGTVKRCVPFLESLITGYMIVLPHDLYVKNNNGQPYLTWNENGVQFAPTFRDEVSSINLVPAGHYPIEYTWQTSVANTVPLGYSVLLTHPFNRHDLPFTTLSGIVDGGFIMSPSGNVPFYIKQGFEGIIPQGTPIAQILPFRQENWSSKKRDGLVKESEKHLRMSQAIFSGWYKKTFWQKKEYL